MTCECKVLRKTMATNWSYYKCVECGMCYFSAGKAEVLDFSEADKQYLASLKSGGKITTEAERKAEETTA